MSDEAPTQAQPADGATPPPAQPPRRRRSRGKRKPTAAATKAVRGRPTLRTPEIETAILDRLCMGESLSKICADDHMPDRRTVLNWITSDQEFYAKYMKAREAQAHTYLDEIRDIADDRANDTAIDEEGYAVPNPLGVRRDELRIRTRQWMVARLAPKAFADTTRVMLGGDPENHAPIVHAINQIVKQADDETLRKLAADEDASDDQAGGSDGTGGATPA